MNTKQRRDAEEKEVERGEHFSGGNHDRRAITEISPDLYIRVGFTVRKILTYHRRRFLQQSESVANNSSQICAAV